MDASTHKKHGKVRIKSYGALIKIKVKSSPINGQPSAKHFYISLPIVLM